MRQIHGLTSAKVSFSGNIADEDDLDGHEAAV
jgi:hypothetical protein